MSVAGIDRVVIATDSDEIYNHSKGFGADVVMTSKDCANGTERCSDALRNMHQDYDIIVNLQGDAPLTPAWFVEDLVNGLKNTPTVAVATPVLRCDGAALNGFVTDRKAGRVGGTTAVFNRSNHALYFSKEVIPFSANVYENHAPTPVFHHVGVYVYRAQVLADYQGWKTGPLEIQEGLEQLRFLENGEDILCVEVDGRGRSFWELNNPSDVERIEQHLCEIGIA